MPQISAAEYCVLMGEEFKTGAFWRDCFAEFLATFLLVASNLFLLQQWNAPVSLVQMSVGIAFTVAALAYGLGDFGGSHMNNAVTFACFIRREICFLKAVIYWVMQGAAAIAAAFFIFAATPEAQIGNLGNTDLASGVTWWQAVAVEALATAMLCFAYLGSFNNERKGYVILSSLPVGLSIGLGMFITTPYSGGSMNSVRSLGPAVVFSVMRDDNQYWTNHWVYWAGPMGGAFLAAILYWIFDCVDARSVARSLYAVPSGFWSYSNYAPVRPQVKLPSTNTVSDMTSPSDYQLRNRKELLNSPDDGPGVYTVNGTTSRPTNNGISAFSRPAFGNHFGNYNYN